jgi:hypothetical protein
MATNHVKLHVLLAVVLMPSVGWATPPVHMVSGGGTVEYAGALNVHAFAAQMDDEGDVRGQAEFQLRHLGLKLKVEIGCLAVIDKGAWLGGIIRNSTDPALVGQVVLFRVQDNNGDGEGEGEEETEGEDMTSQLVIGVTLPECATAPSLGLITWTSGSVSVR